MQKSHLVFITIESDGTIGYIVHDDSIEALTFTLMNRIFDWILCNSMDFVDFLWDFVYFKGFV